MSHQQYWRVSTDYRVHPLLQGQYVFTMGWAGKLNVDFAFMKYEVTVPKKLLCPLPPETEARVNLVMRWNQFKLGGPQGDPDADKVTQLYDQGQRIWQALYRLQEETKARGVAFLSYDDLAHAKQKANILRTIAAKRGDHKALGQVHDLWQQVRQFQTLAAQIAG